jgi:ribonuclease HI
LGVRKRGRAEKKERKLKGFGRIYSMINIYTDGSAKGNPGPGGWGVIMTDGKKVVELGGHQEYTTNNRMELTAAINSLKNIKSFAPKESLPEIRVYTDSEYVMKGITVWIHGWRAKGWKTAAKKPVLNQDLWQELLDQTEGKKINWNYVAGHSGHEANERCDEIAQSFADKNSLVLYDGPREIYPINL